MASVPHQKGLSDVKVNSENILSIYNKHLNWWWFFFRRAFSWLKFVFLFSPVHSSTLFSILHWYSCCFFKLGACWLPSTVYTDMYFIQPHLKKPKLSFKHISRAQHYMFDGFAGWLQEECIFSDQWAYFSNRLLSNETFFGLWGFWNMAPSELGYWIKVFLFETEAKSEVSRQWYHLQCIFFAHTKVVLKSYFIKVIWFFWFCSAFCFSFGYVCILASI